MDEKILKRQNGKEFSFWHIKLYAFHLCNYTNYFLIKLEKKYFPGGPVVKNLPAGTGDKGSIPGLGKIPHVTGQLSLCATTTEPVLRNKRSHHKEKPAPRLKSSSRSPQLEKAHVQQQRPSTIKIKFKKKKKTGEKLIIKFLYTQN